MTPPNLDDLTTTGELKPDELKSETFSVEDLLGPETSDQEVPIWEPSEEDGMAEMGLPIPPKTLMGDSLLHSTEEGRDHLAKTVLPMAGSVLFPPLAVPRILGAMAGPGVSIGRGLISNPGVRTAAEGLANTVGATGQAFLQNPGIKEAAKRILAFSGTATAGAEAGRQVARGIGADDSEYSMGDTALDAGLNLAFSAVPEIGAMRGAMKNAALVSDEAGSAANIFRAGDSRAGWSQAIRQRFTSAWDNIRGSGILQGGTVYDAQAGRMVAGRGAANTDFDTILRNLGEEGTIMSQLSTAKASALGGLHTQINMHRVASGNRDFGSVSLSDLTTEMRGVFARITNAGNSPLRTEVSAGYADAVNRVRAMFGNYNGNRRLDIVEVEGQLAQVYEHLRDLGKYDTDGMAAQMQGIMSDPVARGAAAQVYTAAGDALRRVRNSAIDTVFQEPTVGAALRGINVAPHSVQNASDMQSSAMTIRDTMEHYLYSLNPDAARAMKTQSSAGAGMAKVSQTGIGAATTKLTEPVMDSFGYGASTLAFRNKRDTLNKARDIINYEGPGRITSFLGQAGAGGGVALGNVGRGLMQLPEPSTPNTSELYGHFAKEGFQPKEPMTQGFPRQIKVLVQNQDDFLKAIASKLGMEGAGKVEEILNGKLPPTEKQRALGEFMSQFPEVNELMQKSNFPSEIDGRLHSQEDLSNAASEIENNPKLSIRNKALDWTSLWKDKVYKGKMYA